ncbi:MAG: bacteriohemerythrin [Candidatus Thorarchaeota archaeon]|jgi:hemerythrin
MGDILWNESLSVGVDLIDEQHRMLIERINNLSKAVEKYMGHTKIIETLLFMTEYTDFHFSTEERYMKELDYPAMDNHLKQHEEFKSMLRILEEDFKEDGATKVVSKSIDTFLGNWLINHIKIIDVNFGKFLKDKGVKMSE